MMHAASDPGSVSNVWGFMGVAVMALSAMVGPYLVVKRDKGASPAKAPERVELENAYGVPTDDVSDMAIRLIFSVRQELKDEQRRRANVERRLDTWVSWARDLGQNWDVYRVRNTPPAMPVDDYEEYTR